jgi:cation transport regulator ChaB
MLQQRMMVESLPDNTKSIYQTIFNNALIKYQNEKIAHHVAWNAVLILEKKDKINWLILLFSQYLI